MLGEMTYVSSRIELIELLMLVVPPPRKPAKLPGLMADCVPRE